jgi:hypothetical protein
VTTTSLLPSFGDDGGTYETSLSLVAVHGEPRIVGETEEFLSISLPRNRPISNAAETPERFGSTRVFDWDNYSQGDDWGALDGFID